MSKMKKHPYLVITIFREQPLSFYSLKKISDVYMITIKVIKNIYIGMSTNLKGRFENYLNKKKRLKSNRYTRIHKALLYGFENFSITILELDIKINNKSSAFCSSYICSSYISSSYISSCYI